jgi:hypothetical protein
MVDVKLGAMTFGEETLIYASQPIGQSFLFEGKSQKVMCV